VDLSDSHGEASRAASVEASGHGAKRSKRFRRPSASFDHGANGQPAVLATSRAVLDTIAGSHETAYEDGCSTTDDEIRGSPHGRLWTAVIVESLKQLELALRWQRFDYPRRHAALLDAHGKTPEARRLERLRKLEQRRRRAVWEVRSCSRFFFSPDSQLSFVCDALGYAIGPIREHAQAVLRAQQDN
jgi:hypothetical protein